MKTHPKQIAGNVAFLVIQPCPPPLNLIFILPAQDCHAVSFFHWELIIILSLIIPQSINHSFVHYSHFLLDSCNMKNIQQLNLKDTKKDSWKYCTRAQQQSRKNILMPSITCSSFLSPACQSQPGNWQYCKVSLCPQQADFFFTSCSDYMR